MKTIRSLFEAIILPFVSVAVLIDESKRMNLDGSWDEYHRKRNEKMRRRAERKANQKRYVFPQVKKI